MGANPLTIFPGFEPQGIVSAELLAACVVFNNEAVACLSGIPDAAMAWADIATGVTGGIEVGQARIPIRLSPTQGFEQSTGVRRFNEVTMAAIAATAAPYDLNYHWPAALNRSAVAPMYDFSGLAADMIEQARALKPDLAASLLYEAYLSAADSAATVTAGSTGANGYARTIPQPGLTTGLPLFSGGIAVDGTTELSAKHYAHPKLATSPRFSNLFYGIGKIGDSACKRSITGQMDTGNSVFGQMLLNMARVPHPSKPNMTFGTQVTHVFGPTMMMIPFWESAVKQLTLQLSNPGSWVGAATSNAYNLDVVRQQGAQALMGASGITPWVFHTVPQLDAHPYALAHPGKQFWFAVSANKKNLRWAEFAAPTTEFTPRIVVMGEDTEYCKMHGKVAMLGDMVAGVAAGLPHGIQMYTEDAPAS
jgi:hypothetical protein